LEVPQEVSTWKRGGSNHESPLKERQSKSRPQFELEGEPERKKKLATKKGRGRKDRQRQLRHKQDTKLVTYLSPAHYGQEHLKQHDEPRLTERIGEGRADRRYWRSGTYIVLTGDVVTTLTAHQPGTS